MGTPAIIILICVGIFAICMILFALHRAKTHHFICPKCVTDFQVTGLKFLFTPKTLTTHYVRCPHCGYTAFMEVKEGVK